MENMKSVEKNGREVSMKPPWPRVKLGEVCEVTAGNSAPQEKRLFCQGIYPFVRTSDVGEIHFGHLNSSRDKLNDDGIRNLKLFPKGSILFPKSGASTFLNHRVLLDVDAYVASHLAVIIPETVIDQNYLLYQLATIDAKKLMQDVSYPALRTTEISAVEISLPPLAVQREIVARLERELGAVEKVAKKFEEIERAAEAEFKATLKECFEALGNGQGNGTNGTYGTNGTKLAMVDQMADGAAVASVASRISPSCPMSPSQPPTPCRWVKLGDVCEVICGKTPLKTNVDYWQNGTVPWFTIDDLRQQGKEITFTAQKITELAASSMRVIPANTVLLCCTASIGACCITRIPLTTNQQFNALVTQSSMLMPEYLFYFCGGLTDILLGLSSRTTIDFVSKTKVENISIPLPPLATQRAIVAQLDVASKRHDRLIAAAKKGRETASLWRKAILKEAFE